MESGELCTGDDYKLWAVLVIQGLLLIERVIKNYNQVSCSRHGCVLKKNQSPQHSAESPPTRKRGRAREEE